MAEHTNGGAEHRVFESSSGSADGTKATSEKSPSELAHLLLLLLLLLWLLFCCYDFGCNMSLLLLLLLPVGIVIFFESYYFLLLFFFQAGPRSTGKCPFLRSPLLMMKGGT